jgi:predicted PurR-regulated permease PerM
MGFVGFILGPVLMALLVTVYKMYAEQVSLPASENQTI